MICNSSRGCLESLSHQLEAQSCLQQNPCGRELTEGSLLHSLGKDLHNETVQEDAVDHQTTYLQRPPLGVMTSTAIAVGGPR